MESNDADEPHWIELVEHGNGEDTSEDEEEPPEDGNDATDRVILVEALNRIFSLWNPKVT